jgi:GABA permease
MWLFPYASWAVVAVIVAVLTAMALTPDLRSEFTSSAVVVLIALAAFAVFRRGRAPVRAPA